MKTQELFRKMYDKLGGFEKNGIKNLLEELTNGKKPEESAMLLAKLFEQNLDNGKSDDWEWLLKEILIIKPELASVKAPLNPIFIMTVIHGCFDLYRGYIETGIDIFLKDKSHEEKTDFYFNLSLEAVSVSEKIFPKYKQYYKGMHYNTAFSRSPENPSILKIMEEDIIIYEEIVKNFNSIIGRRDIIDDLNKRSDIDIED